MDNLAVLNSYQNNRLLAWTVDLVEGYQQGIGGRWRVSLCPPCKKGNPGTISRTDYVLGNIYSSNGTRRNAGSLSKTTIRLNDIFTNIQHSGYYWRTT